MKTFHLIRIDYQYCDYLRKYDDKVRYNNGKKILRPYIGVLFKMNGLEYFAPLASPKPKHLKMKEKIDFLKIEKGNLGAINLNNMIPVIKECYQLVDLSKEPEDYAYLLRRQLRFLNRHHKDISKKAKLLYDGYMHKSLNLNIIKRCCNFPLLEEKCVLYQNSATELASL